MRRILLYHQLSITIGDDTTRWKLYLLEKRVGVGTLFIVVAGDLKGKQTNDIDDNNHYCHPTNHKASVFEIVVLHFLRILSIARIKTSVKTVLLPVHISQ